MRIVGAQQIVNVGLAGGRLWGRSRTLPPERGCVGDQPQPHGNEKPLERT
jgi:hypothetical protein